MRILRKLPVAIGMAVGWLVALAVAASAQVQINPTNTPVRNKSGLGPLFGPVSLASVLLVVSLIAVVGMVVAYMRYAPRFARDEAQLKVVRADRVRPGQELPRRAVDVSQAVASVVAPPSVPAVVGTAAAPVAALAPPVAATPAPAAVEAPAAPAPAAPAPAASAPQPVAAPAAPAERREVALDQETFDQVLAELLEKGTDRRVAEGQARRAGMIAARKKAEG